MLSQFGFRVLVGLGINNAEGNLVLAAPEHKLQVDLLQGQAAVDEHEQTHQAFPLFAVIVNNSSKLSTVLLAGFGKAVTGKIDQVPAVVNKEVVNELGFTRGSRSFSQLINHFLINDSWY